MRIYVGDAPLVCDMQMKLQDDVSIFVKQRVNISPADKILHVCVCNNVVIIIMANNLLLTINKENSDKPEGELILVIEFIQCFLNKKSHWRNWYATSLVI